MFDALSPSGLVFVILAWGTIIGITVFCFWKILNSEKHKRSTD